MNPVRNPAYKNMSKKDLKRHVADLEEAYLNLVRQYQVARNQFIMAHGRLAGVLAVTGPVEVSAEDMEGLPENIADIVIRQEVVGDPDDMVRRFSLGEEEDEDAEE